VRRRRLLELDPFARLHRTDEWVCLAAPNGYRACMPQKPQARAKDKRRLTKRLATWRAKQEAKAAPPNAQTKAKTK